MSQSEIQEHIKELGHKKAQIRAEAASALMWFGPEAKAAIPALQKARKDKDWWVRISATEALDRIIVKKSKQ